MKQLRRYFKNKCRLAGISDPEEKWVAKQLCRNLPTSDYAVINDVLIPYTSKGRTTQIDHIVVSVYGIFCIETKSHKGWILAIRAKYLFQQILFKYKYPITPNPVVQNAGHIKALNELLGGKIKSPIMNIVVFPSADKIIVRGYSHVESMHEAIEDITKDHTRVYTYKEASEIIHTICEANIKGRSARINHVAILRSRYSHG